MCLTRFGLLNGQSGTPPAEWFNRIATLLLNESLLIVCGKPHRIREIEFYYNSKVHRDCFTHSTTQQLTTRHWYFHRAGKGYKNGSFKGLDITFGDKSSYGGILIRSLETEAGKFINGSSLCVDHILQLTGFDSVPKLDQHVFKVKVDDPENRLRLIHCGELLEQKIWSSSRVGLSLKKGRLIEDLPRYFASPYRFFVQPTKIKKGRLHFILSLYNSGLSPDRIKKLSGSPKKHIQRHIDSYHKGFNSGQFDDFFEKTLKSSDVSELHGIWQRKYSSPQTQ